MENGSKASPDKPWWSAKQAANFIGVHVETLYIYCRLRKGRPPFVKLGRDHRYRFPKDKFIAWANGSEK